MMITFVNYFMICRCVNIVPNETVVKDRIRKSKTANTKLAFKQELPTLNVHYHIAIDKDVQEEIQDKLRKMFLIDIGLKLHPSIQTIRS